MKSHRGILLAILTGLLPIASSHMQIMSPPPLKSKINPNTDEPDYSMTEPLVPYTLEGGFPCKGYHTLLDIHEGASVANWTAGQTYSINVHGGATHDGGSCQISLSIDSGRTFKVLKSWIGGCPSNIESVDLEFVIPKDVPSTEQAILAWTWFNRMGNQEMYMNCAVIDITGLGYDHHGGKYSHGHGRRHDEVEVGFHERPDMFVANIGEDCNTVEGGALEFPNPGPDLEVDVKHGTVDAVGEACQRKVEVPVPVPVPVPAPAPAPAPSVGDGGYRNPGGQAAPDGQQQHGTSKAHDVDNFKSGNDHPDWYHPNAAPVTPVPYTRCGGN